MFATDSGMSLKVCICIVVGKKKKRAETATSVKADWMLLVKWQSRGRGEASSSNANNISCYWTFTGPHVLGNNKRENRACKVKKPNENQNLAEYQ